MRKTSAQLEPQVHPAYREVTVKFFERKSGKGIDFVFLGTPGEPGKPGLPGKDYTGKSCPSPTPPAPTPAPVPASQPGPPGSPGINFTQIN